MSTIDLPSLSDDELDYELTENDQNAEGVGAVSGHDSQVQSQIKVSYEQETNQADLFVDRSSDCGRTARLEGLDKPSIADRVTRLGRKIKLTPDQILDARKFGIEIKDEEDEEIEKDPIIDAHQLKELHQSLDVSTKDSRFRLNTIFCKGVDKMSDYEVYKIFAEFQPENVQFVDESSCTIRWSTPAKVAHMLLEMTKPLRRVRQPRKAEEGELLESEDEEEVGQLKEEDGEDVAVIDAVKVSKKKRLSVDCETVEVNVEEVRLPAGKWRVVTKHVPENRLMVVRYATGFDIRRGIIDPVKRTRNSFDLQEKQQNVYQDSFEYSWMTKKDKVRPGLNIFDDKGKELDWDYEHDTRFYDDASPATTTAKKRKRSHSSASNSENEDIEVAEKQPEIVQIAGVKIRSRGRGEKKFFAFALDTDSQTKTASQSLVSDEVVVGPTYGKEQANERTTEENG